MGEREYGASVAGAESEIDVDGHDGGRKNERSTIAFPYMDLNTAIAVARAVQREGGYVDRLPEPLGNSSVENGTFKLKMAAARIFGLTEVHRNEARLTDVGSHILDPANAARAKVDAFLAVPLYKQIFERYKGRPLPSNAALEEDMVRLGVAPKQKDKARQAFLRSAEQAGFFEQGKGRLVLPRPGACSEGAPSGSASESLPSEDENMVAAPAPQRPVILPSELPPVFQGLVQSLADNGAAWSEEERKGWLQAIEAAFLFAWPRKRRETGEGES